jgi:small subunit ribosomal protein S13
VARIAGVDLPKDKIILAALPYLYGIGWSATMKILQKTGVAAHTRVHQLTEEQIAKLREVIESEYKIEGALRTEIAMNIKRLMDIGSYRGLRHRRGLPVRGQRTKTNSRTRKGPRKTVGTRKPPPAPK